MSKPKALSIDSASDWDSFLARHPETNFLTSWSWGQFHQALGKTVLYRGYFQAGQLSGVALFVKESAKRGPHFTLAGGPTLDWDNQAVVKEFVTDSLSLAQKHRVWFVRVRPQLLDTPGNTQLLENHGFVKAPMHLEAELTLQLDLTLSQEALLAQMRKNTRYDIRKAERAGVTVTETSDPEEIDAFYQHQLELAKKHGFVPFGHRFLKTQFATFAAKNQASLFHASHGKDLLASAFIIFFQSEAAYHYGISTVNNHHYPGTHAALWAAIQAAKDRGFTRFNLWGIAPENQSRHRFAGVTIFKRGFGGREVAYLPAHDLPVSSLYRFTYNFERIRARVRHL